MKVFRVYKQMSRLCDYRMGTRSTGEIFLLSQRTQRGWLGQIDFQMLTLSWKEPEQTEKRSVVQHKQVLLDQVQLDTSECQDRLHKDSKVWGRNKDNQVLTGCSINAGQIHRKYICKY